MLFRAIKYKPLFSSGISKSHMIFIFPAPQEWRPISLDAPMVFPLRTPFTADVPWFSHDFPMISHSGISQWPNHHVTTTWPPPASFSSNASAIASNWAPDRAQAMGGLLGLLAGWWYTYPSEKYKLVSWDDDIPKIWKNRIHVPNHQPVGYLEI